MAGFVYRGDKTKEISFPIGGIGTGSVGLAGNGRWIDWEIFNRPNKGGANGFSFFAIKAENAEGVLDARVLQGDLPPSYMGTHGSKYSGFGFGPAITTMAGLPHFKDLEFHGGFPIADLKFLDDSFPGSVRMTAFNPFIPLNDKDSSIPAAFVEFEVENTMDCAIAYTVCAALNNPHPDGTTVNQYSTIDQIHMVKLLSSKYAPTDAEYGDLTLAADAAKVSCQAYWYRGRWFDSLAVFWKDFCTADGLVSRSYGKEGLGKDVCSLAGCIRLKPGEKKSLRFVISWSFPNAYNYWSPEDCGCSDCDCSTEKPQTWKNYYATLFEDSVQSAQYALKNWDRLYSETCAFKEALFSSSLPAALIDAISANISILKTPTCLRLEDGSFYGFEGCHCNEGCCEGSCTHVWNYAYALPFLFPKLERSMRDLDYTYNQDAHGGMRFRLQLPLGRTPMDFRPCADGQMGGVLKVYRDWKISGDTEWLRKIWIPVYKSLEYAWSKNNPDRWDEDRDGVMEGRQHHTLDMELFGPNAWLNGFYLAALKAGAEMAEALGAQEKAVEYADLFRKGKEWSDRHLFNGEYYIQQLDLKDRSVLDQYSVGKTLFGDSTADSYWDAEHQEIKYQTGEGCMVDQVIAQWHANLCGLGEIFDKEQTYKALQSIYLYNYKENLRDHVNPCRLYAMNDEAGTLICAWPTGKYEPVIAAPYAQETWSGCEYQVAAHMIQEGLVEEGLKITQAVRNRYDGEKRNPWNEFECGSNYARSMASYALLNAYSGFEFDMVRGMIGFHPVRLDSFSCFWSLDSGWGTFHMSADAIELKVLYGSLEVSAVRLPFLRQCDIQGITCGTQTLGYAAKDGSIQFDCRIRLDNLNPLRLTRCYSTVRKEIKK